MKQNEMILKICWVFVIVKLDGNFYPLCFAHNFPFFTYINGPL
jgi:hypothetical protein